MPLAKLTSFLDEHGKKYVVIKHSKAFTAPEVAASAHVPGKEMAKTVMVKIDGDMNMVVLPSTHQVDLDMLKKTLGTQNVELATEEEFESRFPDCEPGAMPPFGNLYDMETFVAQALREDEEIAFNAGNHREVVKMGYADYEDLVQPTVANLAVRAM